MRLAPAFAVLACASLAATQHPWSAVAVSTHGQGCQLAFPDHGLCLPTFGPTCEGAASRAARIDLR